MTRDRDLSASVIIAGGGLGGCAAALAAARMGHSVVMTEETDWIGGQLTQQAVPPDEHPWIEQFGATQSYYALRARIRDYYRRNYPLTTAAIGDPHLNPGAGLVSRLCHEPRAALAALNELLQPHVSAGRLRVLLNVRVTAAQVEGDRIQGLTATPLYGSEEISLTGRMYLDATETGELLPLCGAEHVTGAESQSETGEPHAPGEADPRCQQAFTCCFAMDYLDGEDHTIEKPAEYDLWRAYVPNLKPGWPGRLLDLTASQPITLEPKTYLFDPPAEAQGQGWGLWRYRRILAAASLAPGSVASDICLVNWPQNDYWLGPLVCDDPAETAAHIESAKQLSLSLLYWLQTEAPLPRGGSGWKGLRLRPDVVDTPDGLAKRPYVRESRRIRAEFTVLEQHVSTAALADRVGPESRQACGEPFSDSVGIGCYRIDLHPSATGDNYVDFSSVPFQIPLRCLVPIRIANLLPACKNIGTTHITNGCFRLHPVEWAIGEAAGTLAAYCVDRQVDPRAVSASETKTLELQRLLARGGAPLEWPAVHPV